MTKFELAEQTVIDEVRKHLLETRTVDEVELWFTTPIIDNQTPLEVIHDGRGRFLIPHMNEFHAKKG